MSPARVSSVEIVDRQLRSARVIVPDYQLSLAIGREGQNARLAARLTGWRIDIRPDTEQTEQTEQTGERREDQRGDRRGEKIPAAGRSDHVTVPRGNCSKPAPKG